MADLAALVADGGADLLGHTIHVGLAPGGLVTDAVFENCTFHGATFTKAVLRRCTFEECTFEACDLSETDFTDSRFITCRFVGCKALAVNWARTATSALAADPMTFRDCRLDLGTFQGLTAAGWVFHSCSLTNVDFAEADLRRVDFTGSDLRAAVFHRTDLRQATFADTRNVILDPRENRLKGARFSTYDAVGLLRAFEIELLD